MNVTYLLALISKLGVALPQAWPIIIRIAADIGSLVALFKDAPKLDFGSSPENQQAVDALVAGGIDSEEAREVVETFAMAGALGL